MVSALAVQINHHLWNDTTSCFKQVKRFVLPIGLPRELVDHTLFTASGVEYDHTGGHETPLNNFLVASNAKPDEIYED
jgi:hypothetical protein